MNKRALVSLLAAPVLAFSLAACGSDDGGNATDNSSNTGAPSLDLISDGTLTVCSDVPYPPFEDFDNASPSGFKGFDVDVVSAIADQLGLSLKIQDSDFAALKSGLALNSGQCDMVASAMTITPEREAAMSFSTPYYDSEQSLLVPVGSDIHAIGDLSGKKVGVQTGTTGETYANANATGASIVPFPSDGEMYQAIQAGQVDALLQDLPVNLDHTKDGKFAIVEKYNTDEHYGFAMKKDNAGLTDAVDGALATLDSNGDLKKIYDTYFATN
jgi:polar amino acid transport system substrate-binding protein